MTLMGVKSARQPRAATRARPGLLRLVSEAFTAAPASPSGSSAWATPISGFPDPPVPHPPSLGTISLPAESLASGQWAIPGETDVGLNPWQGALVLIGLLWVRPRGGGADGGQRC